MTIDRRYVGQIHPDDTRTLWRIDADGGHPIDPIAWAGDGRPGWGSAHDPTQADAELDTTLAILADHCNEPARAFELAERLATTALSQHQFDRDLVVTATDLEFLDVRPTTFRADARPLQDLLAATIADTGDPLDVAAAGLGFPPEWATIIASGETTHLDIDEVKTVCERLYLTPCDLWSPPEAQVIEAFWPANEWPTAQAIDLGAPIGAVGPDTTWHPAIEPAATLPEVSIA